MMSDELKPWECFQDASYYDMWCVRRTDDRTFGEGFHLIRGEEAAALCELLNTLHQPEAAGGDALVEELCRFSAKCDGLDWDEPCGSGPDGEGGCDSSSCVAAFYEDHDADHAREIYRWKVVKFLLPFIRAREAVARREGYEAAREGAARVASNHGRFSRDDFSRGVMRGHEEASAAIRNMGGEDGAD